MICSECNPSAECGECMCQFCEKRPKIELVKECGHKLCERCYSYPVCYICTPVGFCHGCKDPLSQSDTCYHQFCNKCRKKNKCEKCNCSICKRFRVLNSNNCGHSACKECTKASLTCATCYDNTCEICNSKRSPKKRQDICGHLLCLVCYDKKLCRMCYKHLLCKNCNEVKNEVLCVHQYCSKCRKFKNDPCYCRLCNFNKPLKSNVCGHISCANCSANDICEQCLVELCEFCEKPCRTERRQSCNHLVCEECTTSDECLICTSPYFCAFCAKFNRNIKHCEEHKYCFDCIISNKACDCCETCGTSKNTKICQVGHPCCNCMNKKTCADCNQRACGDCGAIGCSKWNIEQNILCRSCMKKRKRVVDIDVDINKCRECHKSMQNEKIDSDGRCIRCRMLSGEEDMKCTFCTSMFVKRPIEDHLFMLPCCAKTVCIKCGILVRDSMSLRLVHTCQ